MRPVERERAGAVQRRQQLTDEERIALRPFIEQVSERRRVQLGAPQCLGDQLVDRRLWQRLEPELANRGWTSLTDRAQAKREQVSVFHLVVAIGADHEQVIHVRFGEQLSQQVGRRRVQPLEIVDEDDEWVLRAGEHPQELAKDATEAVLSFGRPLYRHRRLRTHDPGKIGDQVDDDLGVVAERVAERKAKLAEPRVCFEQELLD
jgi:hypothetical protein